MDNPVTRNISADKVVRYGRILSVIGQKDASASFWEQTRSDNKAGTGHWAVTLPQEAWLALDTAKEKSKPYTLPLSLWFKVMDRVEHEILRHGERESPRELSRNAKRREGILRIHAQLAATELYAVDQLVTLPVTKSLHAVVGDVVHHNGMSIRKQRGTVEDHNRRLRIAARGKRRPVEIDAHFDRFDRLMRQAPRPGTIKQEIAQR